ncbi:MAG: NAD(P)/FAD-dependent oxidoreductase [Actinomycetales bacterium]|mgnify:CR=1 FL=1|nr:NAD(P)/FAD-dependent oxidoreductase [Actinomycetales bacterium]
MSPARTDPVTRIVVVGFGMAAGRLLDDLLVRLPRGRAGSPTAVTVVGAEPYGPYNRVLLTEVLAGRADVAALGTGDPERYADRGIDVRPGRAVTAIDRDRSLVRLDDGTAVPYDRLVLATGAAPVIPPLVETTERGDRPLRHLPAGVHAFRTVDDCREIVAGAAAAREAVVLGGGLLGLETARGLARRGLAVTVLHSGAHVLGRHLDAEAAQVLALGLRRLGLTVRQATSAVRVVTAAGRLAGLVLGDGTRLPADLLVLACGVRPRTELAAAAGIAVGRGVLVDDAVTTSDPRVLAVGDCAEHASGGGGLVATAWEQARVAADLLAGTDRGARYRGRPDVVRLKAAGVEVAAAGETHADPWSTEHRVTRLVDPAGGRYLEVVIADGVVVGAVAVGDARAAAELTLLVDRASPAPPDPAVLLLPADRREATTADQPALIPDRATVCRCNGVTKGAVVRAWDEGARTVDEVSRRTRAGTGCGSCADAVSGLLGWLGTAEPDLAPPALPGAAVPVTTVPGVGPAAVTPPPGDSPGPGAPEGSPGPGAPELSPTPGGQR